MRTVGILLILAAISSASVSDKEFVQAVSSAYLCGAIDATVRNILSLGKELTDETKKWRNMAAKECDTVRVLIGVESP